MKYIKLIAKPRPLSSPTLAFSAESQVFKSKRLFAGCSQSSISFTSLFPLPFLLRHVLLTSCACVIDIGKPPTFVKLPRPNAANRPVELPRQNAANRSVRFGPDFFQGERAKFDILTVGLYDMSAGVDEVMHPVAHGFVLSSVLESCVIYKLVGLGALFVLFFCCERWLSWYERRERLRVVDYRER